MNGSRLDISLEQFEVGLSGAVPDRNAWSEPAMDRAILEFVALFTAIVLKYGGRIVHGSHPTFTPVILRQARLHGGKRFRKPVTLVMSDLWSRDLNSNERAWITDVAELVTTARVGHGGPGDVDTRNRSLSAMRRVLIDSQNVMVAVGGKMHARDGITPGILEEMELAAQKRIPRFLLAGMGGFSAQYADSLIPSSLNNSLSEEENIALFSTTDVSACVNIIFERLATSEELVRSSMQPIKWNPYLNAIVDHRDGSLDVEASGYLAAAH
jgi:hypothetical protein